MKICTKCGALTALSEFSPAKRSSDGLHSWCKPCKSAAENAKRRAAPEAYRERRREARKAHKLANPEAYREYNRLYRERHARRLRLKDRRRAARKHGILLEDYEAMLLIQGGRCATCGVVAARQPTSLHIDHDHSCCPGTFSCGRCVRGLLCSNCNNTLGRVKDDPSLLRSLAVYVEVTT